MEACSPSKSLNAPQAAFVSHQNACLSRSGVASSRTTVAPREKCCQARFANVQLMSSILFQIVRPYAQVVHLYLLRSQHTHSFPFSVAQINKVPGGRKIDPGAYSAGYAEARVKRTGMKGQRLTAAYHMLHMLCRSPTESRMTEELVKPNEAVWPHV